MFSFIRRLDKTDRQLLTACFLMFVSSGFPALTMGSVLPGLSAEYGLSDGFLRSERHCSCQKTRQSVKLIRKR